jgi:hypothetical protein
MSYFGGCAPEKSMKFRLLGNVTVTFGACVCDDDDDC